MDKRVHTVSVLSYKRRSVFTTAMKIISLGAVCFLVYFLAFPKANDAANKKDELTVTDKVSYLFQ